MKIKIVQRICLALGLGLLLGLPFTGYAGGNVPQGSKGNVIAKFTPIKSDQQLEDLKPGDIVLKICRDCGTATMVRVEKPGKGVYDYVAKKCENCGSENTYLCVTKESIPLKDQVKP